MFVLKIIVITSAILNIGSPAVNCGSDPVFEFQCLTPECDSAIVNDKLSVGIRLIKPRHNVTILGQNDDMYLVKSLKGKISKIYRNQVRIFHLANPEHWKFKVNVFKKNFEICESNNQDNEEKDDSSISHISTNTDENIFEISDGNDTSEVLQDVSNEDTEQYDDKLKNETDLFPSDYDNDIDESIEIESEDESDLDDNIVIKPSKIDSDVATHSVDKILSTNSVQLLNSDPVDSDKNNKAKTISQQNIHTSTSDQQLENNFSTKCSLDSCVNGVKENIVTENSRSKISPVSTYDSLQQINDNIQITQQSTNLDKTDNSINESTNNLSPKNINSEVSLQDDKNNGTEESILNNSYQQEIKHVKTTQEPSHLDRTDNWDNNNGTNMNSQLQQKSKPIQTTQQLPSEAEKINVSIKKPVSINTAPQDSNVVVNLKENNNGTKELNVNSSYQAKSDEVETVQELPSLEAKTNVLIKESVSGVGSQNSKTVVVDNDSTGQLNLSQQEYTNSDSLPAITEADNQQVNNNYKQPPLLEKEKVEINNESEISNDNVMPIEDNLKDKIIYQSVVSESKDDIPVLSNDHKESKSQNIQKDNLPNVESNKSNNDSADANTTNSSPLQELINTTKIVTSNDYHKTVVNEMDVTEVLNKKSIDQCTSAECLQSVDNTPNYDYEIMKHQYNTENKELPYENIHKTIDYNNNEQLKEFVPKSFVASFGHPDTCSGVNCLNFKRNVEKIVKSPQPLNPIPKNLQSDEISHSSNIDYEKEIVKENIINEITEQSVVELSLLDHFHNWLSSPTMITIDFVWNIFSDNSSEYNDVYPDAVESQKTLEHNKSIKHSELYFIVVAVVTLLFSLIYYKYQNGTYENHLLTLLAAKDQNLLIIEKELLLLKELNTGNTQSTTERNSEIESLSDHLTKSEDIISSQAIRIENLEQEIVELTENGMEMHTLLSSALESSTQKKEQINTLKVKLVDSENLIAALTKKNFEKSTELEKRIDSGKALSITVEELTNKNNSLAEDKAKLSLQLEEVITKNIVKESKLQSELNNLQFELDKQTHDLMTAKNEALLSKEALQEIMSQKFNPADSKQFSSSIKLSAELKSAKQISEGYKHKLNEALKSNQQFLDHIEVLKSDIVNLENNCSKLETMNEESVNKLNILTKFFKEQEQEYLKQINEKAVLCDDREGESSDLNERIKSLNQEIFNYKSEIQSLKKEITDQETSFKIQISAADKKASDYWISFRQAERKLKEMELETAQLRNKLTMVDKKLENGAKSIDSSKDFEDELLDIPLPTVSPDFTLLTLLDFEPPPPILTNQRLPPLGALGQAPSPPAPLSRRHNRSLSPDSPTSLQRSSAFRPLAQRYNYMNRENSLGHSDESLDK
ncbi:spindle pole body component 110 isoform X2 [Acyrthosiphon pisum]|uniref:Transport and Golgi organization protein 1 n=1 Tax=Acyrthosiphon pisum TaxID=7029 RepID=A0A8R2A539_ACYPI|nr:spindle pole body component 110 isoform X2 [Acyrthosiphon pisum]|eukprot:XP_001948151.2 PREDICTED: putative leucine-rich repeat-containing protein DDB_G0290503 isoform X2 [Acyrthosiphon pisum]